MDRVTSIVVTDAHAAVPDERHYGYDVSGTRVARTENTGTVLYLNIGNDLIEEYTPDNLGTVSYIYESGIDRPIARINESTGEILFYHQDILGNIIALTDNNGVITESYSYDVFGKVTVRDHTGTVKSKTQVNNPFPFTGRELDWATGLYHYRARAYHPELGRFIQTDPIDFDAGDLNVYRYVGNNPVNFVDPSGLDIWNINNSRAVGNIGHAGAIVGQPGGNHFTYHSFGSAGISRINSPSGKGDLDGKSFDNLKDAMDYAKKLGYDRYSQYESDCEGDKAARDKANEWKDDKYNATTHNCQDMVNAMMEAAGVPYIGSGHPNMTYNKNLPLAKSYGSIK